MPAAPLPAHHDGQPRLTLAIENANPANASSPQVRTACAAVALGMVTHGEPARTQVLAVESLREVDRDRDDLIPAIERVLSAAGKARRDIQQVAVSVGPGGFTSTRVACATGAMLAEGLSIPVVAVPSALVAVMHWREQGGGGGGPVAVLLAAKGEAAWCVSVPDAGAQSNAATAARSGTMCVAADVLVLRPSVVLADAHLPASIRTALTTAGVPIHPLVFTAQACLTAAALCEPADPATLVPIYPREPEAVTLWRSRHGPSAPPKG